MLDADTLRSRIRKAMADHKPPISPADLARAFAVTPQAVNGWLKTGRIGKGRLLKLARLTGRPASYFLGADVNESLESEAFRLMEDWLSLKNANHRAAVRETLDYYLEFVAKHPELQYTMADEVVARHIAPAGRSPSVKRQPSK